MVGVSVCGAYYCDDDLGSMIVVNGLVKRESMRVLFWAGNFWPQIGGAEVLAIKLLPALRERGYDFTVITSQRHLVGVPEVTYHDKIPIYRFPLRGNCDNIEQLVEIRRSVTKVKKTIAPDLIHLNAIEEGHFFHLLTAEAHVAPSLITLHDMLSNRPLANNSWRRRLMLTADWVTCVSAAVLEETRRVVPEISSYSSVLYNGQELPFELPQPLPFDYPRLLCLGRLRKKKGFDVALTAFAAIIQRFRGMRLIIAGDGPERPHLEELAVQLGIREAVDFLGWVDPQDVPRLVNTVTVVVMPSRHEPFGLVALDAALMARPIVASDIGGLSEAVTHQETGLLVEPDDSAGLAAAIVFLLEHQEVATHMGQVAHQRAQVEFSWNRCVDAYDELYQKLARRAG